jgi:hypothetical protein
MSQPKYVDPRKLRPGPIRRESLPPDLLGQIRAVYDVIGPHIDITFRRCRSAAESRTRYVPPGSGAAVN